MHRKHAGRISAGNQRFGLALAAAMILVQSIALSAPALDKTKKALKPVHPALNATELFALAKTSGGFLDAVPDAARLNVERIVAFEENPHFIYLAGRAGSSMRRVFLLKPSTFIVDDLFQVGEGDKPAK